MRPFSFWLIDDEREIADSLRLSLRGESTISSWKWFDDCHTALGAFRLEPAANVVLLDVHFDNHSGIDFLPQFLQLAPRTNFLMATVDGECETVQRALRLGARGYLLKPYGMPELLGACQYALRGGMPISPMVVCNLILQNGIDGNGLRKYRLTPTEKIVLHALADGSSAEEIACKLFMSVNTVYTHTKKIGTKLGTSSHGELIARIHKERLA